MSRRLVALVILVGACVLYLDELGHLDDLEKGAPADGS